MEPYEEVKDWPESWKESELSNPGPSLTLGDWSAKIAELAAADSSDALPDGEDVTEVVATLYQTDMLESNEIVGESRSKSIEEIDEILSELRGSVIDSTVVAHLDAIDRQIDPEPSREPFEVKIGTSLIKNPA